MLGYVGSIQQVTTQSFGWVVKLKVNSGATLEFNLYQDSASGISAPPTSGNAHVSVVDEDGGARVIRVISDPTNGTQFAPGSPGDPPPTSPPYIGCGCI